MSTPDAPMDASWDVLIVGAGPAGAAAAFDLAKAGRSVLLLDQSSFPRPKACAAGLTIKTLRALRYPVDPVTHRTIHTIRLEGQAVAPASVTTRSPICVTAVRAEFDEFCLGKTLAAGARFERIGPITRIAEDRSGVTVVTAARSYTARYLIGADGANSQVRRLLHALRSSPPPAAASDSGPSPDAEPAWLHRGFALETHLPLPASVPDLLFDFAIPNGYAWIFPKRDHLNVGLGFFSTAPAPSARAMLAGYIERKLGQSMPAKVVGQYLAMGGESYVPSGRILLAGDAAGTLDPLTAEGIYPAVVSGQAAARALVEALATGAAAAPRYRELTGDLRAQLSFSARAARRFYADPRLGLRAMQMPLMRTAIVRTYALGLSRPAVLSRVAGYALAQFS